MTKEEKKHWTECNKLPTAMKKSRMNEEKGGLYAKLRNESQRSTCSLIAHECAPYEIIQKVQTKSRERWNVISAFAVFGGTKSLTYHPQFGFA